MRSYDLTPLMRSTVGFDRMASLLDSFARADDSTPGYPPYNIEKLGENDYRITMAVAGFGENELDITTQGTTLIVSGKAHEDGADVKYLHRGIARRAFERRFELAEHIEVRGARLDNGLLHIELRREVPEAMKPRTIAIKPASKAETLEHKSAETESVETAEKAA
ncbi:Hsp20 family protein [Ferruginivarius sediminum]|uniref:Molecular chaperone n=1 Tax=Ferruginivarius sediminum TaxID=2661937 RepID=A0A369T743_9PROT|nr:Hsp20 family protein [Ferruginivarius sediminum]RDD61140.1 molecular chaperone [Ferruginivarius sediminum]